MRKYFDKTFNPPPIAQMDLWSLCGRAAPGAYYAAGRAHYLPIVESEMADFLAATQIDRYRWRQALTQSNEIEVVCCTFSALLWALVEQQRLIERLPYPLAFARVEAQRDAGGHSMNGFFNEAKEWRFVEPQNDRIYTTVGASVAYPGLQIQNLMFV